MKLAVLLFTTSLLFAGEKPRKLPKSSERIEILEKQVLQLQEMVLHIHDEDIQRIIKQLNEVTKKLWEMKDLEKSNVASKGR